MQMGSTDGFRARIRRATTSARVDVSDPQALVEFDVEALADVTSVYRRAGEEQRLTLLEEIMDELRETLLSTLPVDEQLRRGKAAATLHDRLLGSQPRRFRATESGGFVQE
jgi:hypothetical protein